MIVITIVCVFFLIRTILIAAGMLKGPLMASFRAYGPVERPYLVGLPLLAWSGAALFMGSLWASRYPSLSFGLGSIGMLLSFVAVLGYNSYDSAVRWHTRLFQYPVWYHDLSERTSRYERRRIAFMWLHLPAKLRLTYSSSDRAFFTWADFVIMGTIREEEYDPKRDEAIYFGGHIGSS